jgi:hypothetical protein
VNRCGQKNHHVVNVVAWRNGQNPEKKKKTAESKTSGLLDHPPCVRRTGCDMGCQPVGSKAA